MSRSLTVIKCIAEGMTLKQIADSIQRSIKTVEWHWAKVKKEYGFQCYQDATQWALARKLIKNKYTA